MNKTAVLISALMIAGLISSSSFAGIRMSASKVPEARVLIGKEYLSNQNDALERALDIHNLMNEMSDLKVSADTLGKVKKQGQYVSQMLDKVNVCNVDKMGSVFKNPQEVWTKMMTAYEQQRQGAEQKLNNKEKVVISAQQREKQNLVGWDTGRSIMLDVYQSPEKWGDVQKDGSFPLWKDQAFLYEKQWNKFYDDLNKAYGVERSGRPEVTEDVRHNPKQYNQVLVAHKAYVNKISKGKKVTEGIANALPPKAPAPLPKWQDIVKVDSKGNPYPELPEPWKQMAENKFKDYSPDGEMAEFFEGKSLKPTEKASIGGMSGLEKEYDLSLAVDALQKGFVGSAGAQNEMMQPVVQKVVELGINMPNFDINDSRQYSELFKRLKEEKKQAINEAYQYVQKLEEQDKNNPELVERRRKFVQQQQNRLPKEAQTDTLESVIQGSLISPASNQRLVLQALEKDENALVYLTETNAVEVDQLMREKRATDKLIVESQQQFKASLEEQEKAISSMNGCSF